MIDEAVTDTNGLSYLVTLYQIYDIVGEENWIHGESNCLVNLASIWTITLSWGAKKKECKEQRRVFFDESLQVGNRVVVENHGNQWPHKAQIVNIDMENKFALIRWEMTQNIDYVDLEDLKCFSMDNSALTRRPRWLDFERKINENCARNLFFLAMVVMARIPIFCKIVRDSNFYDNLRSFPTGYPIILRSKSQKIQNRTIAIIQKRA